MNLKPKTTTIMFNENQIHEIEAHGLTVAQVEAQIEAFKRGFP